MNPNPNLGYEVWPEASRPGAPPPAVGSGLCNTQWVKEIDLATGGVRHVNWSKTFNAIALALGVQPRGCDS